MIEVELPDGSIAEFPDGTPQEVIKTALKKHMVKQNGGLPNRERNAVGQFFYGDNDPTTQNLGEKIGSTVNKGVEALTFGLIGDEFNAAVESAVTGKDYEERRDHYRNQEEILERDNPGLAIGAEIGGAVAAPLGAVGALGKGASMLARSGAAGVTSAGLGGVYGFAEGEGGARERSLEAMQTGALSGGLGAAVPVVGAGIGRIADKLVQRGPKRAALKSARRAADTRAASGAAYDVFEGSDAQITPDAFDRLGQAVKNRLNKEGMTHIPGPMGKLEPNSQKIVDTLMEMGSQLQDAKAAGQNPAVPLKTLDDVRKGMGKYAQEVGTNFRPTNDARLATTAIEEVDAFIETLTEADVPIGDINVARSALSKARELWRQASKMQLVENAIDAQDDYLGGPASAIRNKVASVIRNPKTRRQFNDAELAELRKIIGSNAPVRAIRLAGNGIGRQLQIIAGADMGGIPGALAGALTGELSAEVANRNAIRQAEIARALIAGGTLNKLPTANPAIQRVAEALMRQASGVIPE